MNAALQAKLTQLDRYAKELHGLLQRPVQTEWAEVVDRALERLVQVIVECAADAGDLWLEEHGKPLGQSAASVFQNLRDAGILNDPVYQRLREHVRARNQIVHNYDRVTGSTVRRNAERLSQDIPEIVRALMT